MFCKKVFLEILQNSQANTYARVSFLMKLQADACNFIKKETLAQVFSFEFSEIFKNTFFHKTPLVAPVYNGPSVVIRPSVCALVAIFPCTLKRISCSLFSKGEINFTSMQNRRHGKTQENFM